MSQKNLDDADVHTLREHVRGKTVPERVRSKPIVEAALASRLIEREPRSGVGQVRDEATTGEQPLPATVELPDIPKHLKNRFGQRQRPLFVAFADDAKNHLLRVDRRDGQRYRLGDP